MTNPLNSLTSRQRVLAVVTGTVIVTVMAVQLAVFPAYDTWQLRRARLDEQAAELARLERNIRMRDPVNRAFAELSPALHQQGSDEATFSQCIRQLEVVHRYPTVMVVNAKPLPVVDEGTHKIYKVRVTVAGELPEVVRFVGDLTGSEKAVGIDGFSLRGIQGLSKVECSLSIRMVRLIGPAGSVPPRSSTTPYLMAEKEHGL